MSDSKPILVLDFDATVHLYTTPWTDACTISDRVTAGFFEWAYAAQQVFRLAIYSSRTKEPGAIPAMQTWIRREHAAWIASQPAGYDPGVLEIEFPLSKPAAFLSIDDRAMTFTGNWSDFDPQALRGFRPWNKRPNTATEREESITVSRDLIEQTASFLAWAAMDEAYPPRFAFQTRAGDLARDLSSALAPSANLPTREVA